MRLRYAIFQLLYHIPKKLFNKVLPQNFLLWNNSRVITIKQEKKEILILVRLVQYLGYYLFMTLINQMGI